MFLGSISLPVGPLRVTLFLGSMRICIAEEEESNELKRKLGECTTYAAVRVFKYVNTKVRLLGHRFPV